jgi:hypothetical protein
MFSMLADSNSPLSHPDSFLFLQISKRPCFAAIRSQGIQLPQLPKFALIENRENFSPTSTDLSFNMDIAHNLVANNMHDMDMDKMEERLSQLNEDQVRELYRQYHMMRTGLGPEY